MATTNVGVKDFVLDVVPVLDTSAYAADDVMVETAALVTLLKNEMAYPFSLMVTDIDLTHHCSFEIWILRSEVSIGDLNDAEALAAANAPEVLTIIPIDGDNDYSDAALFSYVEKNLSDTGMGALLQGSEGGELYYALKFTDDDGDSYAVGDLNIKFGFGVVTVS